MAHRREWDSDGQLAGRAPICPWCGVTTLPGSAVGRHDLTFVCDEADCPGFGEPVTGAR